MVLLCSRCWFEPKRSKSECSVLLVVEHRYLRWVTVGGATKAKPATNASFFVAIVGLLMSICSHFIPAAAAPICFEKGVLPNTVRSNTALSAMIPEADMSEEQLKIRGMVDKWHEVRMLTREEAAAQLDGEWLEAHTRFYDKYDADMELMLEIKEKVATMIEPPQVQKKGLKQRKRDKWARVQAREAAAKAK